MARLTIHQNRKSSVHTIEKGVSLLHAIRSLGYEIYSPCGGNGKCGKCKVWVKGEGSVTSCLFVADRDLDITLPDLMEANILTAQYRNTITLSVDPGKSTTLSSYPLGVAIDIGTTTVVLHLINLMTGSLIETRSVLNPQSRYGADVISRINFCILNKNGLSKMQSQLMQDINNELRHFAKALGLDTNDIVKISVSGNTTMLHMFVGMDPASLAFVPFTPKFVDAQHVHAKTLGLNCNAQAEIKTLPCISAYVGADLVAGLASIAPPKDISNYLFVDVGTNGEMALVADEKLYCCATAAGPAFEGANISCGMAAIEGAISAFDNFGVTTIGNSKPSGICGSGLIDIVAFLVENGSLDKTGQLQEDFVIINHKQSGIGTSIRITQQDVRELQLAKSAILSGLNILLRRAGKTFQEIDKLYLAGGFGNFIRTESAVKIGLLPKELKDKIVPVGNASGTGAMLDLKSSQFQEIMQGFMENAHYIDLSDDEDFVTEFALNMDFPVSGNNNR